MKLVKFLQKLNREQVTIELKNGTVISGTVVGVDATMNAHLKKAKLTARGKNPVSYATLSVRGSTVRDWILPDGLNLDALLVEDASKVSFFRAGMFVMGGHFSIIWCTILLYSNITAKHPIALLERTKGGTGRSRRGR